MEGLSKNPSPLPNFPLYWLNGTPPPPLDEEPGDVTIAVRLSKRKTLPVQRYTTPSTIYSSSRKPGEEIKRGVSGRKTKMGQNGRQADKAFEPPDLPLKTQPFGEIPFLNDALTQFIQTSNEAISFEK
jgi:hypothetical protein